MARFVQIVEYTTTRFDEMKAAGDEFRKQREAEGGPEPIRVIVCADLDKPNRYLSIVEFESAEAAAENSGREDTNRFAKKMAELTDGPPIFHNLELVDTWDRDS
jgi:quinol monooxygenase YgiN